MKLFFRVILQALLIFGSLEAMGHSSARADGPFPTEPTPVTPFHFSMMVKLEGPTLIDFPCTLGPQSLASASVTDPDTGARTDTQISLPAGASIVGDEGYTLPKGAIIFKASVSASFLNVGRYAYIGDVPRFEPKNIEMVASKMGHTLRVKTWVTQDTVDRYERNLVLRWKERFDAFSAASIHLVRLKSLSALAAETKGRDEKNLYEALSYYSANYLDNPTINIYDQSVSEPDYSNNILLEILRKNLRDDSLTIQDGLDLAKQYLNDGGFVQKRKENSKALFLAHFADRFVAASDPLNQRIGFLTFVYPIAIDVNGPFGEPTPGLHPFPLGDSVEARWWSDRWGDEYGGFPFLEITADGVAFHGPITLNSGVWFLRRADVSHSCMRMDPSDILELREILPRNIMSLQAQKKTIPLQIIEWPDVIDVKNDQNLGVVDVAYYMTQGNGSKINDPGSLKPHAIQPSFWKKTFLPYFGLPSVNRTLTVTTTTDSNGNPVNQAFFTGLPKYELNNGVLVNTNSDYTQSIPIYTYPMRPTAIIQYREDGVVFDQTAHDQSSGDNQGRYPPSVPQHGN